ncbi:MAG TPA: hypothetical protein ENJ82_14245, partial [Bacteroidetes bacterium]|nr:hypothetical protein [Bacteroidota bacterium]
MEHYWIADFDFCSTNCTNYTVEWRSCCRNGNITTLNSPASTPIYVSTSINPLLSPCNSSPQFTDPPVAYICQNQSYVYNQSAIDPDGDSLSYALGPCMRNDSQTVSYNNFSADSIPLGIGWTVSTDSLTGNLLVAPDTSMFSGIISVGVICIYVQEWRNGQLINTIVRDMQITVIPCPNNTPPELNGFSYISGGTIQGDTIFTCLGTNICADMRVSDPDPGQIQTIWWDTSLAPMGATFTAAGNPGITDTIIGNLPTVRFCWAPTVPGTYSFDVVVRDSACPIYGSNQYTFTVLVGENFALALDSTSGCDSVLLCGTPLSGIAPFTYQWSGSGGINANIHNTDSCFNHQYPSAGLYPYSLTITDSIGCTATFTDTVFIPNNVLANAGPNDSTCSNQPIVLGPLPQANPNLSYHWIPAFGLNNPLLPQPTATIANNSSAATFQTYILELQDSITKCLDMDTLVLTIFPIPASPFFAPAQICQGSPVGIAYTGNNAPTATYNWTFDQGSPATLSGQGPHQVFWTTPGLHEITLTVTENGCSSPIQRDTIDVIPIPTAQIAQVADQCLINNLFSFQNQGIYGNNATFQWTFGPNASQATSNLEHPSGLEFTTAGTKTITLQVFENGCGGNIDTLILQVTPDPSPNWAIQGGIQCFSGNSLQFQVTGNNGPNATYQWVFQNGNPATSTNTIETVSFLSSGPQLVTLTVSENGCTRFRTDTIFVAPEPQVSTSPNAEFCEGEGGVLISAIASGGTAPYAYTWSCGNAPCGIDSLFDDDPMVNPGFTTWYYVQVTDAFGCQSPVDSVLVTVLQKPRVNAGPDFAICDD